MSTGIFAVALILATLSEGQWIYIHAHRQSPFLLLTMFGALANGLLIWWWGSQWGVFGAANAYLGMNLLFALPVWTWVWFRCRDEWHRIEPQSDGA
ncbi:MAG: hypothetical protein R3C05_19745 [Pirellulaceae bacterium]